MTENGAADVTALFVYGTLMRGGVRHPMLAGQRFLAEARTCPYYALFDLGAYPGLVRALTEGQVVYGELYEIDASMIARLDRIEGAPSLYRLEPIRIEGPVHEVFAYLYQQDTRGLPRFPDGRWRHKGVTS